MLHFGTFAAIVKRTPQQKASSEDGNGGSHTSSPKIEIPNSDGRSSDTARSNGTSNASNSPTEADKSGDSGVDSDALKSDVFTTTLKRPPGSPETAVTETRVQTRSSSSSSSSSLPSSSSREETESTSAQTSPTTNTPTPTDSSEQTTSTKKSESATSHSTVDNSPESPTSWLETLPHTPASSPTGIGLGHDGDSSSSGSLSGGILAAIIVGSVVVAIVLGTLFAWLCCKSRLKRQRSVKRQPFDPIEPSLPTCASTISPDSEKFPTDIIQGFPGNIGPAGRSVGTSHQPSSQDHSQYSTRSGPAAPTDEFVAFRPTAQAPPQQNSPVELEANNFHWNYPAQYDIPRYHSPFAPPPPPRAQSQGERRVAPPGGAPPGREGWRRPLMNNRTASSGHIPLSSDYTYHRTDPGFQGHSRVSSYRGNTAPGPGSLAKRTSSFDQQWPLRNSMMPPSSPYDRDLHLRRGPGFGIPLPLRVGPMGRVAAPPNRNHGSPQPSRTPASSVKASESKEDPPCSELPQPPADAESKKEETMPVEDSTVTNPDKPAEGDKLL